MFTLKVTFPPVRREFRKRKMPVALQQPAPINLTLCDLSSFCFSNYSLESFRMIYC